MPSSRPWIAAAAVMALAGPALAGTEDWQVNEVLASADGDPNIRYVELRNDAGGCLFPTSRVEVRDAGGVLIGAVAPADVTTCYDPGTYFLLATPGAEERFDRTADAPLTAAVPASVGQVCFASSTTRYDCVRYGEVTSAVTDFFGPDDMTTAPALPDGIALARIATTHVVADDWQLATPTPRGPNDGTPWFPPDAGPTPDARIIPDAAPPPDAPPDAMPRPDAPGRPDAANTIFLDLDPVGGASCGCRVGGQQRSAGWLAALALGALLVALRRRRG